jgi:isoleucyl-tRNA synthetase
VPQGDLAAQVASLDVDLNDIFIVSEARVVDTLDGGDIFQGKEIEGLAIKVSKASGEKCDRCWRFDENLGTDPDHPTTCPRCTQALKAILG